MTRSNAVRVTSVLVVLLCAGTTAQPVEQTRDQRGGRGKRSDDLPALQVVVEDLAHKVNQLTAQLAALRNDHRHLQNSFDAARTAVAFKAHLSANTVNVAAQGTIVYHAVTTNVGNAYDAQTGMFTAPVAGVYVFFANCMAREMTEEHVYITVDGAVNIAGCYSYMRQQGSPYEQGGTLSTVHLTAGQRVWVKMSEDAQTVVGSIWNSFAGFLIRADE